MGLAGRAPAGLGAWLRLTAIAIASASGNSGHHRSGRSALQWNGSVATAMPYEPGSSHCRVLIDCKAQVETMLMALSRIEDSEAIRTQLLQVHQQLEALHDQHRGRPAHPPVDKEVQLA